MNIMKYNISQIYTVRINKYFNVLYRTRNDHIK